MKSEGGRRKDERGSACSASKHSSFILRPSSFILLTAAALLLSGCGFHLRRAAALPFDSIYVQPGDARQFANQLKRAITAGSEARVADKAEDAQVVLQITRELREREILALSGGGRVREFQLRYRVSYRLTDNKNANEYIPPSEIVLRRDLTYNDTEVLSKESEETLLFRDMMADAVQQLLRRLQAAKLQAKS